MEAPRLFLGHDRRRGARRTAPIARSQHAPLRKRDYRRALPRTCPQPRAMATWREIPKHHLGESSHPTGSPGIVGTENAPPPTRGEPRYIRILTYCEIIHYT